MQETIVLGTAMGYSPEQLAPFVVSLRRAGYTGDIALVVDRKLAAQLHRAADFKDVMIIPAPHWYPMKFGFFRRRKLLTLLGWPLLFPMWLVIRLLGGLPVGAALRLRLQIAIGIYSFPPTESRYFHYLRFLQRHGGYQRFLISDVRDVVFQTDPFASLPAQGLAVGIESRQLKLGEEHWNRRFVWRAYGDAMLDKLSDKPIACSGVTYGDRAAMLRYLTLMSGAILSRGFMAMLECIDQGVHNTLLWTGRYGDFTCLESLQSPLATLSGASEDTLRLDSAGRLLNADGSVVSILHQYDRLPSLSAVLRRNTTGMG